MIVNLKFKKIQYFKGHQTKLNVTDEQFEEFEFIIHLYLDFCQKEKVLNLKKYIFVILIEYRKTLLLVP